MPSVFSALSISIQPFLRCLLFDFAVVVVVSVTFMVSLLIIFIAASYPPTQTLSLFMYIRASPRSVGLGMDNLDGLHERVIKELSDAGLLDLLQTVALNTIGVHLHPEPHFFLLPVEVDNAVSALLVVTQVLDQRDTIFDAALQNCQAAWKRALESLDVTGKGLLRAEDVAAAMSYSTHLSQFRALWLRLFGPAYPSSSPREVPPHMFAVCWSQLRSADRVDWIRVVQESAQRTISELQLGNAPAFTYVLFVMQRALAVRVTLLECLAEMFENSAARIEVMVVVRYMYVAYEALQEMAELQMLWERMGLFLAERIASCVRLDDYEAHTCGDVGFDSHRDYTMPCAARMHALLPTRCPFLWILQRLVWCMYGRLSLLFSSCFFMAIPFQPLRQSALQQGKRELEQQQHLEWEGEGGEQQQCEEKRMSNASSQPSSPALHPPLYLNFADTDDGERNFLDMCGCHLLGKSLWDITHERRGATLLVITDCTRRRGRRAWQHNRYTVNTTTAITNVATDDDASGVQGFSHWVLNFVFPRSRLSRDASRREQQEAMLLHSIVFQAAGSTERRLHFKNIGSVFYVVRSDNDTDGGRLHFILLLHRDTAASGAMEGMSLTAAEEKEEEEFRWAFRSLETVCAEWSMPHICNLAIRLAAWGR